MRFGDASTRGDSAAVHAVVQQENGTTQGLVCSKSRLAKRISTIPRLELVAGDMAINLVTNVQLAIDLYPVSIHCWLDSTVALYWIRGQGEYRQFVANRVHKIQQQQDVKWQHVPTTENPEDLGSRAGSVDHHELWNQGPSWLSEKKLKSLEAIEFITVYRTPRQTKTYLLGQWLDIQGHQEMAPTSAER